MNPFGWDLHTIVGVSSLAYAINAPLAAGSLIDITLDWSRHVAWTDVNGNGTAEAADNFVQSESLDNLDLTLLLNGVAIAKSMSTTDNVEHLDFPITEAGNYSIQIDRLDVPGSGNDELYGLAWSVAAVPEPATIFLILSGIAVLLGRRVRKPTAL